TLALEKNTHTHIHTRVLGAHILLVGTHADSFEPEEVQRRCKKIHRQVMENEASIVADLSRTMAPCQDSQQLTPSRPKIEPRVLAVSCTNGHGFGELCDRILTLAADKKAFPPPRLPPQWGHVDTLIRNLRDEGRNMVR
ncbi:unnamed protein product, partial [Discosporangium mesarthrocarpum]